MKRAWNITKRPIMAVMLASGAFICGCPPAVVDIGVRLFEGFADGMNSSGLLDTILNAMTGGA
jgi:hypothetical protein